MSGWRGTKFALVVHPELGVLSQYQALLSANGFTTVVARDLPTALLAITQHYFDLSIVSSQLGEAGDGWPLAGVLHLVFPGSYIGVLVHGAELLTLQSAINSGVQDVYEITQSPQSVVSASIAASKLVDSGKPSSGRPVH
jgi:DNA-binding NtrC family response regulator